MNSIYKFTASALPNNKKGILKPDGNGYYEIVVGGLNINNSMNQFYALEGAKDLFQESSALMRRIDRGAVRGEVGHPRRQPGMSDQDYINRLYEILETNTCCQFKEVSLDASYGNKVGRPGVVAVIAKVTPSGPHGPALEKAFQNPGENVCFSVRGITEDFYENGKYIRELKQIVCWDWVNEPGIDIAEKYKSPSIESLAQCDDLTNITLMKVELEDMLTYNRVATESSKLALVKETLEIMNKEDIIRDKIKSW